MTLDVFGGESNHSKLEGVLAAGYARVADTSSSRGREDSRRRWLRVKLECHAGLGLRKKINVY